MARRRSTLPAIVLATIRRQQQLDENHRPKAKPKHHPIFKGEKRRHVTDRIVTILKGFRYSRWEYEAACRHGLRRSLCLEGYGWHRADNEAAEIVAAALRIIGGGQRPAWIQGQPEYTTPRENCRRCGDELDDEQIARRAPFCDEVCEKAAREHRSELVTYLNARAENHVRQLFIKANLPKINCANPACGKEFKPSSTDVQFCSPACGMAMSARAIKERECANPNCDVRWKPARRGNSKFCCHECSVEARALLLPKKECANARCPHGRTFQPRHETQMYCCHNCKQQGRYYDKKTYHEPQTCALEGCPNTFTPKKAGAQYCCDSCAKKAAYRRSRMKRAA